MDSICGSGVLGTACLPCSSTNDINDDEVLLDGPVLLEVIRSVVSLSPVAKIMQLNEVCSGWRFWTERAIRHSDDLRLEIPAGNGIGITVQGSYMETAEKALECVQFLLSQMDCVRRLTIYFRGPSLEALNTILDFLLLNGKVRLESIYVSGRRGGMRINKLSRLIAKCSQTLRFVRKIGISEFEDALLENNSLHLERLSLTNHDLLNESVDLNAMASDMHAAFSRISARQPDIRLRHISISAVSGFNPAVSPYNQFLKIADVSSLRVALQSGNLLSSEDVMPSAILPSVQSLEVDEFPEHLHSPSVIRAIFPCLQTVSVRSLHIPLRDLEHALAYASEWITAFMDINLEGILTSEVPYKYDPMTCDKIRCHLDDLERCGARLRLNALDSFCSYPTQFIITNAAQTFQFTVHCASDLWLLSDILDFDYDVPSLPCIT